MKLATLPTKFHKTGIALAIALAMSLCVLPLAACSGQSDSGSSQGGGGETATLDPSSWTTLGDALANQTELLAAGNNDKTYIIVFAAGDETYRAVAQMKPDTEKALEGLEFFNPDDTQKIVDALSGLELVSAEEISSTRLSDDEIQSYVGKTGQDLVDNGFKFESYFMYGGDQTGASMGNGYYSYEFTFDTQVAEDKTDDEGAAILSAKIVEAQNMGNLSNAALDVMAES